MSNYEHKDKITGEGLAITDWNNLSGAVAGKSGLTLALETSHKVGIGGAASSTAKLEVFGSCAISGGDKKDAPDKSMHITDDCILFGGKNASRDPDSGQISVGKHVDNSLNILGVSTDKDYRTRKVDILADGGLTVRGGQTITGALQVNGNVTASKFSGDGSGLTNLNLGSSQSMPELTVSGGSKKDTPDTSMHITNDCILFGGNNAGREADSGQISVGKHVANSLNIVGVTTGDYTTRKVDIFAYGGLTVNGPQTINGRMILNGGGITLNEYGNEFQMWVLKDMLIFHLKNSRNGTGKGMCWDGDTNWDSYSDENLKTNIQTEDGILQRLLQLDVKSYQWKDGHGQDRRKIGVVAQDVKPLFPELVGSITDPETKDTNMTVKYAQFGVLAIGGLKELNAELQTTVARQNQLIEKLQARIERLEQQS